MQQHSLRTAPHPAKLGYWQLAEKPRPEGERASPVLGLLTFNRARWAAATIRLIPETAGIGLLRHFYVLMPEEGRLEVNHNDAASALEPGDFVLLDGARPSVITFSPSRTLCVGIPASMLAAHLPEATLIVGIPIRGIRGAGYVASTLIRTVAAALESGLPKDAGYRIAASVLELVATSFLTEEIVGSHGITQAELRRLRAKRLTEVHLQDPRLSPTFIAQTMRVSTRYLRMLFEGQGEPLSRYIQRRRLESCAARLRADTGQRITLTDLAFSYGFSSMAHFSRLFRARFGMTAREYRAIACSETRTEPTLTA